mmetsp:Transcript_39241/g.155669  ORF Transcript_39241/g.155669 Transcript_39241/m.155669 type:complete len:109 (-) Transcript_39241:230-556(-)
MAGCSEETLSPLESLFMCMGKRAISCGDVGSGQVAKVCNNLILGISMTAVSFAENRLRLGSNVACQKAGNGGATVDGYRKLFLGPLLVIGHVPSGTERHGKRSVIKRL